MSDDSSDEETRVRIGNIPTKWYENFRHLGYDIEGKRVTRKDYDRDELLEQIKKSEDP
jgi:ribosome biogenesis protein ERB1